MNLMWFLEFINLNLATLSDDELFGKAHDLANMCHWLDDFSLSPPLAEPNLYESELTAKYDENDLIQRINDVKDEIRAIQSDLKQFSNMLLDEAWGSVADLGLLPAELHGAPYRLDLGVLRVSIAASISIANPIQTPRQRTRGGKASPLDPKYPDIPSFEVITTAQPDSLGARYKFLEALNGAALVKIAKCEGCGGFFLRTSEHEQKFCDPKCASKTGKKRKRLLEKRFEQEAYERYLQGGRQRSAKSYASKVKRNNPHAIITRRPRKASSKPEEE